MTSRVGREKRESGEMIDGGELARGEKDKEK